MGWEIYFLDMSLWQNDLDYENEYYIGVALHFLLHFKYQGTMTDFESLLFILLLLYLLTTENLDKR